MITYNLNVPNGPNNPSVDYPNMQINTNALNTFLSIDHVGFNASPNPNGYHKTIHQVPLNADPATIANIGQIYSKNVTVNAISDTQLFFRTGLGGISQLTGNSAGTSGYQWIGGTLLQWGTTTASGTGSRVVVFNAAPNFDFPNACFQVIVQLQAIPLVTGSWGVTNITSTGFTLQTVTSAVPSGRPFSWFAIGY